MSSKHFVHQRKKAFVQQYQKLYRLLMKVSMVFQYLQASKADGMDVYLLEYTTDHKLIRRIKKYCRKKKYDYYIADSLELGI